MAANTDKLKKYKSLFATTLSTGIGTGTSDTITPATVTGLPTTTAITLTFDRVDSGGASLGTQVERITGVVSGGNLTSYVRAKDNTTEQAHAGGAVIEMVWNAQDWNDAIDWALVGHNQDGSHGASVIVASNMAASSVTAGRISASAVTSGTLAASAVVAGNLAANAVLLGNLAASSVASENLNFVVAGAMTDAGAYVKPSTDGDEIRAYHSDTTSYIEIGNDGTNSKVTSGTGHVDLVPATSKLVRISTRHKADTTDSYQGLVIIEHGWGFITGAGSDRKGTKTVTLPTALTTILSVNITPLGYKDSSDPTAITDFGDGYYDLSAGVSNITTTNFIAFIVNTQGTNLDNGRRFGFSWEVKGIL